MSGLEDALRDALRRQEPSAGFTERVMGRLGSPRPAPPGRWNYLRGLLRLPTLRLAAAGALCLLVGAGIHHQREQAKVEFAQRQLAVALQITNQKLDFVRERMRQSSSAQRRFRIALSPGILAASKEKP